MAAVAADFSAKAEAEVVEERAACGGGGGLGVWRAAERRSCAGPMFVKPRVETPLRGVVSCVFVV